MKTYSIRHLYSLLALVVFAALFFASTSTPNINTNFPAAQTPVIIKTFSIHSWPMDPNFYSSGGTYYLIVSYNLGNKLILKENGIEIPYFDGNDPLNDKHTVYTLKSGPIINGDKSSDTIRIFQTVSMQPQGKTSTIDLIEHSANSNYAGTSNEYSTPKSFKVVQIRDLPTLVSSNTLLGKVYTQEFINWSVNSCKHVKLFYGAQLIDQKTDPGFFGLSGSTPIILSYDTKFIIEATNAIMQVVTFELSPVVKPCYPSNGYDGNFKSFSFSVKCASDPPFSIWESGCDRDEAKIKATLLYHNCMVN